MAKSVYIAGVGLTKVDLTGRVFGSVFDLFAEAYRGALEDSRIRSFGAVQIGIMDSEEFENRANIAAKVADRLGLTGVPAIRSETASSTGAAAFHEAYYKVASGQCENVLVLAGERMKTVTTQAATNGDPLVEPQTNSLIRRPSRQIAHCSSHRQVLFASGYIAMSNLQPDSFTAKFYADPVVQIDRLEDGP